MSYYDRSRQTADIGEFARLREEPRLHSIKDVEDGYSDLERARDLMTELLINHVRAAAETTNAWVSERDEELFRASVKEMLDDLYAPVERRVNRAWRERSYTSPNSEHRFGAADYGVSERRAVA